MIEEIARQVLTLEKTPCDTMLFGSYARGDQNAESDIDVLQVVKKVSPARKVGKIVVSCYTIRQLVNLAKQGSLFILHLRMEGVILHDPNHVLRSALDCYVAPATYDKLLSTISVAAAVLHLRIDSLNANQASGVVSLGIYLLRTLIYVRCVEMGTPAFSLDRAQVILGEHRAFRFLAQRRKLFQNPQNFSLEEIRDLIEDLMDRTVEHLGSGLDAIAVNATRKDREAGKLVTRILLGDSNVHYELLVEENL
jgi:predicted nucleotidyltransferase